MSKKHFVALADMIQSANPTGEVFSENAIALLANFCENHNGRFKRGRWIEYIKGNCGKNGGKVK